MGYPRLWSSTYYLLISHLFALCLNIKKLLFEISSAITPVQSEPGSDNNKEVIHFSFNSSLIGVSSFGKVLFLYSDAFGLLYSLRLFSVSSRTLVGKVFTRVEIQSYSKAAANYATEHSLEKSYPVQRCSRCILHPQPTRPQDTRWRSLTPCRDAVVVFYIPSRLGHRTLVGQVLPRAEMQSLYSTSPAH